MKTSNVVLVKELSAISLILSLILLGSSAGWAQEKDGSMKQQIVGAWSLVSQYVDQGGGKKTERFGSNPRGRAIFESNGRYLWTILHTTLPKFASNNAMTGTADENKAIVQGSITYFGDYVVNDKEGTLVMHVDASSYPNWDGEDQKRNVSISGDEMKIVVMGSSIGGTAYTVWKRVK
jgi:Lipocalin-like domain